MFPAVEHLSIVCCVAHLCVQLFTQLVIVMPRRRQLKIFDLLDYSSKTRK